MSSEKKKQENIKVGDEALVKAQTFTKKAWNRWNPDWESAGRFYREAVKAYKLAGDDKKTIAAARESAIAHDELGQFLQTASDLELAASLLGKSSDHAEKALAYELYKEAAINYRKNNSYDKCAAMLVKAADLMDAEADQQLSIDALNEATDLFIDENRGAFHDTTFKKAISTAIKYQRFEDAIRYMQKQNQLIKDQNLMSTFENDYYKNILCQMVLYYHMGEPDSAREVLDKAEQENNKFTGSDQFDCANALAEAYDEEDSEKLGEALKKNPFKYILNPVAVIARKLRIQSSGAVKKKKPKPPRRIADLEEGAGKVEEKDDDDFT